jgi:hypothetical protein
MRFRSARPNLGGPDLIADVVGDGVGVALKVRGKARYLRSSTVVDNWD